MYKSRIAKLIGFACASIFLIVAFIGIKNAFSKLANKIVAFEQKAHRVVVGDDSRKVLGIMSPYEPTTNNMDLPVGTSKVLVFRYQGLIWIYFLGENGEVVRITNSKT